MPQWHCHGSFLIDLVGENNPWKLHTCKFHISNQLKLAAGIFVYIPKNVSMSSDFNQKIQQKKKKRRNVHQFYNPNPFIMNPDKKKKKKKNLLYWTNYISLIKISCTWFSNNNNCCT